MFMILPWLFEKHFRHLTSSTRGTRRPSVQSPCTCPRGPYWSACVSCLTHSKSMFEHHVFTLKDASEGIIIWQKRMWNYFSISRLYQLIPFLYHGCQIALTLMDFWLGYCIKKFCIHCCHGSFVHVGSHQMWNCHLVSVAGSLFLDPNSLKQKSFPTHQSNTVH